MATVEFLLVGCMTSGVVNIVSVIVTTDKGTVFAEPKKTDSKSFCFK